MSSDLESPALPDPRAIADRVAVLLDQESDLRGLG
jgi:hypothetical protein